MVSLLKSGLAAAMAALLFPAIAAAQTSRITGVVRDETGAAIRGVIVRAATGGTGTSGAPLNLTTATDARGRFVFMVNRSGEWRLLFEAPGFGARTLSVGVRLMSTPPNVDVKLEREESPEAFGALAGVDSKAVMTQLQAAAALYDEGRYDQALSAYRDIKTKVPALTLVSLQIGNILLAQKSYADAEAAFQEVLKADASDPNAMFAMGALREAQGNALEAQEWFQKASGADQTWTQPLMKLAAMASAAGDRTAASRHLARVIDLAPESADGQKAAQLQKELR